MITTLLRYVLCIGLCTTLGLMPYAPEPHLLEKLRLLFTGSVMQPLDLFDLFLHAAPWVALLGMSITDLTLLGLRRRQTDST